MSRSRSWAPGGAGVVRPDSPDRPAAAARRLAVALAALLATPLGACGGPRAPEASAPPDPADASPAGSTAATRGIAPAPDSIRALYTSGRPFADFLEAARSRRDQWLDHYRAATVPDSLLSRARAVDGRWRILAIAEDWCGDSANTIPYLARLAEALPGVEMRVVDSKRGRGVMQAHRTADGRPATPTVVLYDGAWREVGALVERPAPLAAWTEEHRVGMSSEALHEHIYAWYDRDAGATTIAQVVTMMEHGH